MEDLISFDQLIDVLIRIFGELESKALQESELSELSLKQMVYLESIARMEQPTFSDLARRLGVSKPSVTAIVSKLIEKGYVEKMQSAEDKRIFYILLTEKGHGLNKMHSNLHRQIANHFSSALEPSEINQLGLLLHKVILSIAK
jgi:DNA-binding MarR family transcriptional regulator